MFTILRDKFHIKFQGKWYFSELTKDLIPIDLRGYSGLDCSGLVHVVSTSDYSYSFFNSSDMLEHTSLDKIVVTNKQGTELTLYEEHNSVVIKFLEVTRITKYLGIE